MALNRDFSCCRPVLQCWPVAAGHWAASRGIRELLALENGSALRFLQSSEAENRGRISLKPIWTVAGDLQLTERFAVVIFFHL